VTQWLAKLISPEQALTMFNNMDNGELRQALRQYLPEFAPDKFGIFVEEVEREMVRRAGTRK
jgi:hypothetical protein